MDMHQGHAARTCSKDVQHGHTEWTSRRVVQHGHAAWTSCVEMLQTFSMNMKQRHRAKTRSMGIQHGHAAWTCTCMYCTRIRTCTNMYMFLHTYMYIYTHIFIHLELVKFRFVSFRRIFRRNFAERKRNMALAKRKKFFLGETVIIIDPYFHIENLHSRIELSTFHDKIK
jgi:hypothetical protein